jgi:hypothetical protein
MKRNDIDLDVYNIIKDTPEEDAVFYFRAGPSDADDFLYAKGVISLMGEALANMMDQNEDLVAVVHEAVKIYME